MWLYITLQLIPMVLADENFEDSIKEKVAMALFNTERKEIMSGKPLLPLLAFGAQQTRLDMSSLVSSYSWLIFQLLYLTGPQDWLKISKYCRNLLPTSQFAISLLSVEYILCQVSSHTVTPKISAKLYSSV